MFNWINFENPVAIWWVALSTAAVFNILFWTWTKVYKYSDHPINKLKSFWGEPKNIIWFSAIYTFVCAFRSFFPRADVQRICLWDSWLSSVFLGRTLATFGELAFVVQWVIVLRFLGSQTKSALVSKISFVIFPLIFMAECFSWYAVIRTHYLGNAIEESTWALTYFLILISCLILFKKLSKALKLAALFSAVGCLLYVIFMLTVDVPMYVNRLIIDNTNNKVLLGFFEGLADLNKRWIVTYSISDWKSEIPWQTLYFTMAVLVSIALCYVPLEKKSLEKYLK